MIYCKTPYFTPAPYCMCLSDWMVGEVNHDTYEYSRFGCHALLPFNIKLYLFLYEFFYGAIIRYIIWWSIYTLRCQSKNHVINNCQTSNGHQSEQTSLGPLCTYSRNKTYLHQQAFFTTYSILSLYRNHLHDIMHVSISWCTVVHHICRDGPPKNGSTLKMHKWHAQDLCVRLVKGLHKPYQALPSASMGNGTINFAGEHH